MKRRNSLEWPCTYNKIQMSVFEEVPWICQGFGFKHVTSSHLYGLVTF